MVCALTVCLTTALAQKNPQEYEVVPTFGTTLQGIANGSDGALWFVTKSGGNQVGRITTLGAVSEFPLPGGYTTLGAILTGPDGALYLTVTSATNLVIARMTTSGAFTGLYPITSTGTTSVSAMTVGPDGAIWLAENSGVGRITTAGAYSLVSSGYSAVGITTGSDNNLWVSQGSGLIGKLTTSGGLTTYAVPNASQSALGSITSGADGALWFLIPSALSVGRITTAGAITMFPVNGGFNFGNLGSIAAGYDGALWFTTEGAAERITTAGTVNTYAFSGDGAGIIAGPDSAMWLTDYLNFEIGRVVATVPVPIAPVISSITPNPIAVGSPATSIGIVGSGLVGTSAYPCSGSPQTVTWSGTTLPISAVSLTELDVTVPASFLSSPGDFAVTVSVNQISGSSCEALTATAVVQVITSVGGGTLGAQPGNVVFSAPFGQVPAPQTIEITSTKGTIPYEVTVTYPPGGPLNWLTIAPATGSADPRDPGSLTISVNSSAATFQKGTYTATLNVSALPGDPKVTVTLYVPSASMVFGAVTSSAMAPAGPQDPQGLNVASIGPSGTFNFTIESSTTPTGPPGGCVGQATTSLLTSSQWLIINGSTTTGSSTTNQNLQVSVQPTGLVPGTYVDYISLVPVGSTAETPVEVSLIVVPTPSQTFNFSYASGGAVPAAQSASFSSNCGVQLSFVVGAASDQGWLGVNLPGDPPTNTITIGPGVSFNITVTPSQPGGTPLAAGTYYGTVAVTDNSGEASVMLCVLTVTAAPSTASTTTVLSASPNPASSIQTVTLTATVSPSAATGTVAFYDGTTSLGNATLSSGVATMSMQFAFGSHTLTAVYSGDTNDSPSSSTPINLQVNGAVAPTTITISPLPATISPGNPVVLFATVSPATATGTVALIDSGTPLGSTPLSGGMAGFLISTLPPGSHTLTVSYSGDANDAASNSVPVTVTILSSAQQPR